MPNKSEHNISNNIFKAASSASPKNAASPSATPKNAAYPSAAPKNAATVPYGGGPAAKNLPMQMLGQQRCAEFVKKKRTGTG